MYVVERIKKTGIGFLSSVCGRTDKKNYNIGNVFTIYLFFVKNKNEMIEIIFVNLYYDLVKYIYIIIFFHLSFYIC